MKRKFVKSITAISALLLVYSLSSLGSIINSPSTEIKEVKADYDPFITFSTSRVVGRAGEVSDYITATLNGYQGEFDVYSGVVAGGSDYIKVVDDVITGYSIKFKIEFKKAGVAQANVIFATKDYEEIATGTIDVYCESGGDYSISRFADNGYHSLYFGDKGYLEFTAPSEYSKVTGAITNNQRCTIDSVIDGNESTYKINFTTNIYTPDYEHGDKWVQPGVCLLTINCENELDSTQKIETFIYMYIDVYEYDSALFIAWDFASTLNTNCTNSPLDKKTYWDIYVKDYYFDGYERGNEAIEIINNVRYEMPDRNTVVKLSDNNIPYSIVHGVSQYDYMIETYGFTPHGQLNRDTSNARGSVSDINQMSEYIESHNILIIVIIAVSLLSVTTLCLLRKKKRK